MKKLSCKQARQIDLAGYLSSLGHHPKKIKGQENWYLSPFREERTASFKINRNRNIWFDFGEGKGGDIIDFGKRYFNCTTAELLEKLSQYQSLPLSFHLQKPASPNNLQQSSSAAFSATEKNEPGSGKIIILDDRPLVASALQQYLQKRCIPLDVAKQFCREVDFELYGNEYTVIGFANARGGFELRSETFKGSSSPKAITFYENGSSQLNVFEGFFDFLSYQTLHKNNFPHQSNSLVLNSLAFFHQSKELMDKHEAVNLYLDRNKQGMEFTRQAIAWDKERYFDRSKHFRQGQDLNDFLIERKASLRIDLLPQESNHSIRKGRRL